MVMDFTGVGLGGVVGERGGIIHAALLITLT